MKKSLKAAVATASAVGMYLQTAVVSGVNAQTPNPGNILSVTKPVGYATNASGLIQFILRAVLAIGALLVFGYLVMGGIEYITSGGEKSKTESARNKITAAIVGLIILAASWAILNLALNFLGFGDLNSAVNQVGTINQVTP